MRVIVVGAGPAGSTLAYYLATAGVEVIVLEKTGFPREKICGDGLTPRAVREMNLMGIEHPESEGWRKNKGLRLIGGGHTMEMPWPALSGFPEYGLVRTREGFDEALARRAQAAGADLREHVFVTDPILDESGRLIGVRTTGTDARGRKVGPEENFHGDLVVAADGISARLALAMGVEKRDDRPMGVAVRTYFESPRHDDDWLESWVELRAPGEDGRPGEVLPGYGWIFGVGDGTSNVGLGILNTSKQFGKVDYRKVLTSWTSSLPEEWGYREENQRGPVRGAALPMAFNRTPHYRDGLMLIGDAGGMVNPFNGEGIAYAMESARLAAEVVADAAHLPAAARERSLAAYPELVRDRFGSYFTLGRGFTEVIGRPALMQLGVKYGLGSTVLMRFVVKLLANLTETPHRPDRDAYDRLIHALERLTPATSNQ
ncbi:geranylgeranyl reductase family protein [Sediminivirga luteola]|uniref:Drug:proton antiporter n=1 Tax=Sediminivirga luteola TaxID=1774748 RepID=A0A8J2XK66_9MICO|nr:geranylgeranyl reductase family protein [Sediminivirga luteola]MCI2265435.1 geranylgeranyl reductase family protein [Sediminivirga luteola]GGA11202.1 drug:proton antiporter [Sediminivirga luteola]